MRSTPPGPGVALVRFTMFYLFIVVAVTVIMYLLISFRILSGEGQALAPSHRSLRR